jgi:serine/threonine protein kinase
LSRSAGTRLGPYEIVAAIGAGGRCEVYKAQDTRLERTVAVKVLPQHARAAGRRDELGGRVKR